MRKKPLPPPLNVFWFGLITLPSKLRVWYRSTYREEVEASEAGFTLVPSQQDLDKLQAREGEALKRCLQSQERREKETLEARIDKLQGSVAKTNEQGRANLESFNGRLDEIREMLEEIAQK